MTTIISEAPDAIREIDPVERFINRLAAYEPIEPAAREALRRHVQRVPRIPAGETHQENVAPDLPILLSGWVCHFRLFGNGRRQITSVVVPGDLVDFSFLTGGLATLQFKTTIASQFGRIRMSQFAEIADEFPAIMRAALRASATEAALRQERVVSLGSRTAVERVAHILCELWHRLRLVGLVDSDNAYDLPMTQSDLGEALGLSMVHVNRTVQLLRRDGIITLDRRRVTLHHPDRLIDIAGFDPSYLGFGLPPR